MPLTKQISTIIKTKTITSVPRDNTLNPCGQRQTKSDSSYASVISLYRAQRCEGCPLGGLCKKAKGNRTIYVNHKLNAYKKEAFLLLTSEEGMKHESQRPIEPEAAFGQMKADTITSDSGISERTKFTWT